MTTVRRAPYWQLPTIDYVSTGSPPAHRVFADRAQLDRVWAATIARFRRPEEAK